MYNNIFSTYTVVHFLTLCYALRNLHSFKGLLHIKVVIHKIGMVDHWRCMCNVSEWTSVLFVHPVVTWLCAICPLTLSKFVLVCYKLLHKPSIQQTLITENWAYTCIMHTCLTNVLNFFVDVSAILLSDVHSTIFYEQISELKAALGTLSARGEKYCSEACLRRYLEARNWNVAKSRKMLEESLKWRAAYKPEDIRWVNLFFLFCHPCIALFLFLWSLAKSLNIILTAF